MQGSSRDKKSNSFQKLISGYDLKAEYSSEDFSIDACRIIAFYLPQFHEVEENSEWWGAGFTDWVNVAKARPLFNGHYQPHIPRDLGFYDASFESTLASQIELAQEYGVYGFCFYWYWFDGRRMLSKPIDTFFNSKIEFPYCFCWANESWTRTWDHNPKQVLIEQTYSEGWQDNFLRDLSMYWQDNRYIKVDNRPLIIIYRAKQIPDCHNAIKELRKSSLTLLGVDPYIVIVDFYDVESSSEFGADALVEFPPHKFWHESNRGETPSDIQESFAGRIISYEKVLIQSVDRIIPKGEKIFRALIPSWDNTARLSNRSVIIQNTNPQLFKVWLDALRQYTRENRLLNENFLFINAWNEWAEGAHLEPDLKIGNGFLNQIKKSQFFQSDLDYMSKKYVLDRLGITSDNIDRNAYFSADYYSPPNSIKMKFASQIEKISPTLYRLLRRLYRWTLR
jgi:hypothetical protein